MYTQCPDCATAFRVTASVLKQAAGKVRCGGCGSAFNALEYLSETKPSAPPPNGAAETLPELKPEPPDETTENDSPQAMSAAQSAALLKTLDELAGSNIRLEDTGVEWRLLPDDEEEANEQFDEEANEASELLQAGDTPVDAELPAEPGDSHIDELLEASPTRVDEFLTKTPGDIDAAEVFEDAGKHAEDELRFDDNTGLPDDFDDDANSGRPTTAAEKPEPTVDNFTEPFEHTETQVDLVFGDPDEWNELLDEVDDADNDVAASPPDLSEAILEPEPVEDRDPSTGMTFVEELDAITDDDGDVTAGSGEIPPDIDTQFGLQAEALGIESSGIRDVEEDASIDEDLMAAAFKAEEAAKQIGLEDEDAEFAADEQPLADVAADAPETDEVEGEASDTKADGGESDADSNIDGEDKGTDTDSAAAIEGDAADIESAPDRDDSGAVEFPDSTTALELELAASVETDTPPQEAQASADHTLDDEHDRAAASRANDFVILPETEEEQTINRMIDQDLLSLAVEDDDGMTSTMVLRAQAEKAGSGDDKDDAVKQSFLPPGARADMGVETIIMEGEFIRTALEEEALAEASKQRDDEATADAETGFIAAAKRTFRGRMDEDTADAGRGSFRLVAGIALLSLLLGGQFVHQSRAQLATIPTVNKVLAPVYRAVGAPITPDWDVTGWRFEVTRGSTNAAGLAAKLRADGRGVSIVADGSEAPESDAGVDIVADEPEASETDTGDDTPPVAMDEPEVLTIYSRIGNKSDGPLPYPLVSVSLTDRFEETIGSRVLRPREYLTGSFDPGTLVPSGNSFDAVITIESPAADATGFKLNVCYRESVGRLRCAIEDFK